MRVVQELYWVLAAVHIAAVVVTGILWTVIDLVPGSGLRPHLRISGPCTSARSTWCRGF
jgi:hypothetical protein